MVTMPKEAKQLTLLPSKPCSPCTRKLFSSQQEPAILENLHKGVEDVANACRAGKKNEVQKAHVKIV